MKTVITLLMIIILTSTVYAEVYKWEDSNGVHYTDNANSVPEKYREKVLVEPKVETKNTPPQYGVGINQQSNAVSLDNQAADYQANVDQQRRAADAMRQQQARALAQSTKNAEGAFQSLARFMAVWILVGILLFITWISTIVDIVSSEFINPSNKTVWVLLVILIPLLGMLLYFIFGYSQKCKSMSYKDKEREELLARLNPRNPNDKDFDI